MKTYVFCVFVFFHVVSNSESAENNGNKLGDVMKNHTRSVYNFTKTQNEEDGLLKQETHKLLSECGVETPENNYDDDDYNRNNRKNNKNYNYGNSNRRRNSNRRYNNRDNSNESEYGSDRYGSRGNRYSNYGNDDDNDGNNRYGNRRNANKRYGSNRYNSENYSDEDSNESNQSGNNRKNGMRRYNRTMSSSNNKSYGYGNSNRNNNGDTSNGYNNEYNSDCKDENRGYYDGNTRNQWKFNNNEGSYGYDRNYGYGFGNNGNMRRALSGPGYNRNFDVNLRAKRSNDDYDSQCVSQCVFGYLEVLDDNRVPSETLVIKWLQDRLSNDMKRIRALREARRCFARLSTSDIEDGCEFSKSLSKCLNLELE